MSKSAPAANSVKPQTTDIVLALMPYADLERPSLGLSLLQAAVKKNGFTCSTVYANLEFAARSGMPANHMMQLIPFTTLLGEWVFRQAAFPGPEPDPAALLKEGARSFAAYMFPGKGGAIDEVIIAELQRLRSLAGQFINDTAEEILRLCPRIVGCSSSFQQHIASLALLKRIKELAPNVKTVIGGTNCEVEMGAATARECPWIDAVVSGEAESCFPKLCELLLSKKGRAHARPLPEGVITRETADCPEAQSRASIHDLDSLPDPDFDDYFKALDKFKFKEAIRPGLLMETSRGCWWGDRRGCIFCGLNRLGKTYRIKTPARARAELERLTARHGIKSMEMVDNLLSHDYFNTFLAGLAADKPGYNIFYETRTSLSHEQAKTLADAGVTYIQAGLEALSDELLRHMRKGVSAFQNIQTLKYARELGIKVVWHLLGGFPGENDEWHKLTAEWLPLIYHLQPPTSARRITMQRFSPIYEDPARFGIKLSPHPSYRLIYPFSEKSIAQMAFFFLPDPPIPEKLPGFCALQARALEWNRLHATSLPPLLCSTDHGKSIEFFDTRPCAPERRPVLRGLAADIFRACEPAASEERILARLKKMCRANPGAANIRRTIKVLLQKKLLLCINARYLALAVPGEQPDPASSFPGGSISIPGLKSYFLDKLPQNHEKKQAP